MVKAVIHRTQGPDAKFEFVEDWKVPDRKAEEVRISVKSSSYNPVDTKLKSGIRGPVDLPKVAGRELAGIVEEADESSKFKPGDRVWSFLPWSEGGWVETGNFAEKNVALAPKKLAIDSELGTVPLVALTAFQALDVCNLKPGDRILIHAGAGGVGHVAIQLAKNYFKAYVVTTSRQIDFCKGLGADEVVDYTKEDFSEKYPPKSFKAIVDLVGGDAEVKGYGLIAEGGVYSFIRNSGDVEGRREAAKAWTDKTYHYIICQANAEQLELIGRLVDVGKLKPHIGKVLPLHQAGEAEGLLNSVSGKIAIKI